MEEKKVGLIKDEISERIVETTERLALSSGEVTVRMIIREMGVSNRVFYNRFCNVQEVLEIVYTNTVEKVRESLATEYDGKGDFFDYVVEAVAETLVLSYDVKMKFNQYVFNYDSVTQSNYEWYMDRIKNLFSYAKERDLIKEGIDSDTLSYAIWCFCRGYNADAVMRLQKEEALEKFKYSFRILLNGFKK